MPVCVRISMCVHISECMHISVCVHISECMHISVCVHAPNLMMLIRFIRNNFEMYLHTTFD